MKKLFAAVLAAALSCAPAAAQVAQVLPQFSVDKTGTCPTISVRNAVAGTTVPIGCLSGGTLALPTATKIGTAGTGAAIVDLGSLSTATTPALRFHSSGVSSVYDGSITSTGGSIAGNNKGTLIFNASTLNMQGAISAFNRVDQTITGAGVVGSDNRFAGWFKATNTGAASTAWTYSYTQSGNSQGSFSIGVADLADFPAITAGGQGLAHWMVSQSPRTTTNSWGVFNMEINSVNLAADFGYYRKRVLANRWTGGLQIVPESTDLLTGNTLSGYPSLFGVMLSHSSGVSAGYGYKAQTYNGILIEDDAIAPGGVGVQLEGATVDGSYDRTTDAYRPGYGIRLESNWGVGLDTRLAAFKGNNAVTLADGHKVCFATTDACLYHSGGKLYYDIAGVHMFSVADSTGNAIFKGTVTASGTP